MVSRPAVPYSQEGWVRDEATATTNDTMALVSRKRAGSRSARKKPAAFG